jgi:hypothetical protein
MTIGDTAFITVQVISPGSGTTKSVTVQGTTGALIDGTQTISGIVNYFSGTLV